MKKSYESVTIARYELSAAELDDLMYDFAVWTKLLNDPDADMNKTTDQFCRIIDKLHDMGVSMDKDIQQLIFVLNFFNKCYSTNGCSKDKFEMIVKRINELTNFHIDF